MDKEAFKEYLQNRYYDQCEYYDRTSVKYQKKYRRFQWLLIVLSAITPVIAALNSEVIKLQIPLVIVSALVAILTTGLKTFNYQELWVSYRSTHEQLKPEIYYFTFEAGPYSEPGIDKENLFVTRVESILDKERKSWPPAKKLQDGNSKKDEAGEQTPGKTKT
jgi:hypothetical protein